MICIHSILVPPNSLVNAVPVALSVYRRKNARIDTSGAEQRWFAEGIHNLCKLINETRSFLINGFLPSDAENVANDVVVTGVSPQVHQITHGIICRVLIIDDPISE